MCNNATILVGSGEHIVETLLNIFGGKLHQNIIDLPPQSVPAVLHIIVNDNVGREQMCTPSKKEIKI